MSIFFIIFNNASSDLLEKIMQVMFLPIIFLGLFWIVTYKKINYNERSFISRLFNFSSSEVKLKGGIVTLITGIIFALILFSGKIVV